MQACAERKGVLKNRQLFADGLILVGDLCFAFITFGVLILVVITACEKLLSPKFIFVFEYFIYSSTECILYTPGGAVNMFLLIILCITFTRLRVRFLTRCKAYKSSLFWQWKTAKNTPAKYKKLCLS